MSQTLLNTKKNDPALWGPSFWKTLYFIVLSYDPYSSETVIATRELFDNLQYLLPCSVCRDHYATIIAEHPLTDDILSSRSLLLQWLLLVNNKVNEATGKPLITLDKLDDYLTTRKTPVNNVDNVDNDSNMLWFAIGSGLVIMGLVSILIFKRRRKN